MDLCLAPSKPDLVFNKPVRLSALKPNDLAAYYIGQSEAVTVTWDEKESARIIQSMYPSVIFLTPDTSDRPGMVCTRLKVISYEGGKHEIFFSRKVEDAWQPWNSTMAARYGAV